MAARREPADAARAIVVASAYMTLATADADGQPWATPVWYAPESSGDLLWVSRPDARHSLNLAARPQLGIVIFDSHAVPGTGVGVYIAATAAEVPEDEREEAIAVFSDRSRSQGLAAWAAADVTAPAPHRLYRATAVERFYGEHDRRTRVA
jgi:pyridoxine/pyridoxamine 5'-phosphate oxidase